MKIKHTPYDLYRVSYKLPNYDSWINHKYFRTKTGALNCVLKLKNNYEKWTYRITWYPSAYSIDGVIIYDNI